MTVQTREQTILQAISQEGEHDWKALESRAQSLPAMILRHGTLPVKLFLHSKGDSDCALWKLVEKGIRAVLQDARVDEGGLARMPLEEYLLLNEVAAESAALVARWVKIRGAGG